MAKKKNIEFPAWGSVYPHLEGTIRNPVNHVRGKWIEFTARPGDMFLIKGKKILIGHLNCV